MSFKVQHISVHSDIEAYLWDLTTAVRQHGSVSTAPSNRGRTDLLLATRTVAAVLASEYVIPAHIQLVFDKALSHRIGLTKAAIDQGMLTIDVVRESFDSVPSPV